MSSVQPNLLVFTLIDFEFDATLKLLPWILILDFYRKTMAVVDDVIDWVTWMLTIYEEKHFSAKVSKQNSHHHFKCLSKRHILKSFKVKTCVQHEKNICPSDINLLKIVDTKEIRSLHKRWSFPLRVSSVNVTKSAFFVQWF